MSAPARTPWDLGISCSLIHLLSALRECAVAFPASRMMIAAHGTGHRFTEAPEPEQSIIGNERSVPLRLQFQANLWEAKHHGDDDDDDAVDEHVTIWHQTICSRIAPFSACLAGGLEMWREGSALVAPQCHAPRKTMMMSLAGLVLDRNNSCQSFNFHRSPPIGPPGRGLMCEGHGLIERQTVEGSRFFCFFVWLMGTSFMFRL